MKQNEIDKYINTLNFCYVNVDKYLSKIISRKDIRNTDKYNGSKQQHQDLHDIQMAHKKLQELYMKCDNILNAIIETNNDVND